MSDDLIQVPRETVRILVETLDDAWWVKAAGALADLRAALAQAPPDPFPTFGGDP